MSGNIFFIGDLHFGHKKVITMPVRNELGFNSIDEHDQFLVDNWNKTVKTKDVVYVLGDLALSKTAYMQYVPQLKGYKKLIRGNHDLLSDELYLQDFTKLYGAFLLKKDDIRMIMTHIPIHPQEFYRWNFNIHGHLHSKIVDDNRYINVSCEHTNFKPVEYTELMENNHGCHF